MTDELYVCKNCGCSNHDVIADKKCPATGKEHDWSFCYSTEEEMIREKEHEEEEEVKTFFADGVDLIN